MSSTTYTAPLRLADDERVDLELIICRACHDKRDYLRASAILLSSDGMTPADAASILNVTPGMVRSWRRIFVREGLPGLFRPRRVQQPRKYPRAITETILSIAKRPPPAGKRWWTAKLIASQIEGVPHKHVSKIIVKAGIDLRAGRRQKYRY